MLQMKITCARTKTRCSQIHKLGKTKASLWHRSRLCLILDLCQRPRNLNRPRFGCEVSATIQAHIAPKKDVSFSLCSDDPCEQGIISLYWDHGCLQSGFLVKTLCNGVCMQDVDWHVEKHLPENREKQDWAVGKLSCDAIATEDSVLTENPRERTALQSYPNRANEAIH